MVIYYRLRFTCLILEDGVTSCKQYVCVFVNRKGVVFHHATATPPAVFISWQKWLDFGWEGLLHPAYSPDIAPSSYKLFCLPNLWWYGGCENSITKLVLSRAQEFYRRGIHFLPNRWQGVWDEFNLVSMLSVQQDDDILSIYRLISNIWLLISPFVMFSVIGSCYGASGWKLCSLFWNTLYLFMSHGVDMNVKIFARNYATLRIKCMPDKRINFML